jgi:hypothetical protein
MDRRDLSILTRALFGVLGLFSAVGCIAAAGNLINGDGPLWWNVCTLIQAPVISLSFVSVAVRQGD